MLSYVTFYFSYREYQTRRRVVFYMTLMTFHAWLQRLVRIVNFGDIDTS